MIRTVYHFDDLGRKVPVGSYDDGSKAVGGRIFYIDPNSDETVEFYDAQGNVLSNVGVGDTPSYYKVTSEGVSGKSKYFVYADTISYGSGCWTYKDSNNNNVYFDFGKLSGGKDATEAVLSADEGAYGNYNNTIWNKLLSVRTNKLSDCNDWYISGYSETYYIKKFIDEYKDSLGLTDIFADHAIWSSTNTSAQYAYCWNVGTLSNQDKSLNKYFIAARQF